MNPRRWYIAATPAVVAWAWWLIIEIRNMYRRDNEAATVIEDKCPHGFRRGDRCFRCPRRYND